MTQINKKQKGIRTNKATAGMVEGSHQYVDQMMRRTPVKPQVI